MGNGEKSTYKGFTIEHFPLKWKIAEKEFETDGYIILSETKLGEGLYLPLYCEDEKGKNLNFQTLDEAKKWIDNFGDNYHIVVKNRDEIHAIPNNQIEDSLKEGEKRMKKYNIGDSVKFKDGRKGVIFDCDEKYYYAEDNQGCTRKIAKAEDNIIPKEVEEIYTKPFEKKMEDEKSEEPKANYTHVVYLWPNAGYSLYPFYVNCDTNNTYDILAGAVAQAVEKGEKMFYFTEEELEDLTDEEKDEYIYLD